MQIYKIQYTRFKCKLKCSRYTRLTMQFIFYQVKCARYWALVHMTKTFENYKVRTKVERNLGGIIKRTIGVTKLDSKVSY